MYTIGTFFAQIAAGVEEMGLSHIGEALDIARAHGICAADISAADIEENTASLLSGAGMKTASVYHSNPIEFKTDSLYFASTERMKLAADKAISVGSPYFMYCPHPPKGTTAEDRAALVDAVRSQFAELCAYLKDKPITATVEDFSIDDRGYASYDDIAFLLEHNPTLMFTYDSGNFTLAGFDEVEGAKRFANRTVHAHIKDITFTDESYPCPIIRGGKYYKGVRLGDGFVRNLEAMKLIADGGFKDGCFIFELSNKVGRFKKTLDSVKWMQKAINML